MPSGQLEWCFLKTYIFSLVHYLLIQPRENSKIIFSIVSFSLQVKACILTVNPITKAIRLSLRPVFLQPGSQLGHLSSDRIGTVVAHSSVKSFHKNVGAVFTLDDGTLAFAHVSSLKPIVPCFNSGTQDLEIPL